MRTIDILYIVNKHNGNNAVCSSWFSLQSNYTYEEISNLDYRMDESQARNVIFRKKEEKRKSEWVIEASKGSCIQTKATRT